MDEPATLLGQPADSSWSRLALEEAARAQSFLEENSRVEGSANYCFKQLHLTCCYLNISMPCEMYFKLVRKRLAEHTRLISAL